MVCTCSCTGLWLDAPAADGAFVHLHGIVDEQLDPHRRESDGSRPTNAMRRRLTREEEPGIVHCQAGDDVSASVHVPQQGRAEGTLVELDRRAGVADSQHRRDLRHPLTP